MPNDTSTAADLDTQILATLERRMRNTKFSPGMCVRSIGSDRRIRGRCEAMAKAGKIRKGKSALGVHFAAVDAGAVAFRRAADTARKAQVARVMAAAEAMGIDAGEINSHSGSVNLTAEQFLALLAR